MPHSLVIAHQQLTDSELAHLAIMHVLQFGYQRHTVECSQCRDTFSVDAMFARIHGEIWCAWCAANKGPL